MPWKKVTVMSQKEQFIEHYVKGDYGKFSHLCREFGISRKTGYKWVNRVHSFGTAGLKEANRRPKNSPSKTTQEIQELILNTRNLFPNWGGEKLRSYLISKGYRDLPNEKTISRILKRHGLITLEESEKHKPWKRFEHENPNDLWQMDFKGHFATLDGRCHPLTLLDDHSRFCLLIRSCCDEKNQTVQEALITVFREYGLPLRMTMDNGPPWGYSGVQNHTTLTAWLIRIGIIVSHSRPNHPQTQGKLERFHRTLKLELLSRYQFSDLAQAQEGFDWYKHLYNEIRPHASLMGEVPSSRYCRSERNYPEDLKPIVYDEKLIVRKVQQGGLISFKGKEYRIGGAFYGHPVGLKEGEEEDLFDVYFCHQKIVKIDIKYPAS